VLEAEIFEVLEGPAAAENSLRALGVF